MTTLEGLAIATGSAAAGWFVLVTALGAWGTTTADLIITGFGAVTIGGGTLALAVGSDEV